MFKDKKDYREGRWLRPFWPRPRCLTPLWCWRPGNHQRRRSSHPGFCTCDGDSTKQRKQFKLYKTRDFNKRIEQIFNLEYRTYISFALDWWNIKSSIFIYSMPFSLVLKDFLLRVLEYNKGNLLVSILNFIA